MYDPKFTDDAISDKPTETIDTIGNIQHTSDGMCTPIYQNNANLWPRKVDTSISHLYLGFKSGSVVV